jgi:hypothetical protein
MAKRAPASPPIEIDIQIERWPIDGCIGSKKCWSPRSILRRRVRPT